MRWRGQRSSLPIMLFLLTNIVKAFINPSQYHHHPIIKDPRPHESLLPRASQRGANDDRLSRRELLIPAILSFGSGILILRNNIKEDAAYDKTHKEIFSAISGQDFKNILEVGIGEAVNIKYYREGTSVTGIDPYVRENAIIPAKEKARKKDIALSVQKAGAEALPFADGSFDAVVSTLTFCTIPDPVKALQEISRVLRPGGKFIFIEHIEAPKDTFLYYQQELLDPLQALLADGCHLVRHTEELFQSNVASSASSKEKNALFSKIEQFETLDLQMKWPICRQIAGVLVK